MKKTGADAFLVKFTLLFLPLVYLQGYFSYSSMRYFFLGLMACILLVLTVRRFIQNRWLFSSLFKSWYFYGLTTYLFSFLLVSFTSIDPGLSFFSTFQRTNGAFTTLFVSILALSVYTLVAMYGERVIRQFLSASIWGAMILSLMISFSPVGFSWFNWYWLATSTGGAMVGNSSLASSYVLWNIFFAVILFIKSESIKKKIFWAISFLILTLSPMFVSFATLLGSQAYEGIMSLVGSARGATLGIILGTIVTLATYLALQTTKLKKYLGVLILGVIVAGVVWTGCVLMQESSSLHQKFAENVGINRFIFWDTAIKGFKENPILGEGPSTFNYTFHKFFDSRILLPKTSIEAFADEAHNFFVQTLVDGGLLLISSLIFFLISIVGGLVKTVKNNKLSALEASLFIGAFSGWLFQAQFVFESPLSMAMLFLLCGIVYGSIANRPEAKKQSNYYFGGKEKAIIYITIIVSVALFVYSVALPYYKNRKMFYAYDTKLPERIPMWGQTGGISPMGDFTDAVLMFNNAFNSYNNEKQILVSWEPERKQIILDDLDALIQYISTLTADGKVYDLMVIQVKLMYVRMFIANDFNTDMFLKAKVLTESATLLSPTDPQPLWISAQLEVARNNFIEAKRLLEEALILGPGLERTHISLLQIAEWTHDTEFFNFALKRAQESIPGFVYATQ